MQTITKTYNIYSYNELSESAKQVARDWYYECSLNDEWWDSVYEDARMIGLEITGFDIDRSSFVSSKLLKDAEDIINLIISNHGESCGTYQLAVKYNKQYRNFPIDEEKGTWWTDEREALSEQFKKELEKEYLDMLRKDYEYFTSRENIEENIAANEYTFLENGKRSN